MRPRPPRRAVAPKARPGPVPRWGGGGGRAIFILIRGLRDGIWIPDALCVGLERVFIAEKSRESSPQMVSFGPSLGALSAIYEVRRPHVRPLASHHAADLHHLALTGAQLHLCSPACGTDKLCYDRLSTSQVRVSGHHATSTAQLTHALQTRPTSLSRCLHVRIWGRLHQAEYRTRACKSVCAAQAHRGMLLANAAHAALSRESHHIATMTAHAALGARRTARGCG